MISDIVKFRMGTRDWPYVIEYYGQSENSGETELLTHRTSSRPRPALLATAQRVARSAMLYHGLDLLVQAAVGEERRVWYSLSSVTWSEGDDPGTKVEIHLHTILGLKGQSKSADLKLMLTKIDFREEVESITQGGLTTFRPVTGSPKNELNEAVRLLRDQVQAYAGGECEGRQEELFQRAK